MFYLQFSCNIFFKDYIKESLRSSLYRVGNSIAWVLEMQ